MSPSPSAFFDSSADIRDLLLYSFDYPPNDGGVARLCSEISVHCALGGVEVKVIAPASNGKTPSNPALTHELRVRSSRPWREWDSYCELTHRKATGPVICGLWYPEGLLAQLSGVRPRVILAHGLELMPCPARWRRKLWGRMLRWVCESADLVIANSEYTRNLVIERAPRANVLAIPLAVDPVRFSPGNREEAKSRFGVVDKVVLLTVARLHEYRGHDVVLRAMAACSNRSRRDLVYLIAGRGPHQSRLERKVAELGLRDHVRFLGFVSDDDLPQLYRASDLFVMCTRASDERQEVEGFGLAFLEAQACGVPVIGTRTGGVPEAIEEGEGGSLIEQDDFQGLSRLFSLLIDKPIALFAAGERARVRVERQCTWEQYTCRVLAALRSLTISKDVEK
jgi:phosphatidylinositol alpha-1,6-mannosyltransferase